MSQIDLWKRNWEPFKDMGVFSRGMDRWLEDIYGPSSLRQNLSRNLLSPSVEVQENKNSYQLKFDLPGVSKDQIKIDIHENTLTVSGERREEKKEEDKEKKTHFSEVSYGSFSRNFTFPERIDAEKSEAKFENGVLNLSIPKSEQSSKRQIFVK